MPLHVLTLSTLFPDGTRPNFGVFVERQTRGLAARADCDVTVVAPIGIPPWPLSLAAHYAPLRALPKVEQWQGMTVHRPRFPVVPKIGGRFHVAAMTRALLPLVRSIHAEKPIDVIDASFFFPDGPVAANLARALDIPFSVKARGADIHYWGEHRVTRALDRFQPGDREAAKATWQVIGPAVLCVGALIDRKGQELLIRALPALPDVTLLLAGHGPEAGRYEKLAGELGVGSRVRLLGSVPHGDLPQLYNAADVMALVSASEGLANAWVEALACGTPLVLSDVGGARELVASEAAGRIVERTPEAIAAAISDLLASSPNRDAVRSAALPFTWSANSDALFAHLSAMVANPA
jgi:teichuronic acid biosynthesis glycosyltransferase TuaC